jgi:hypothetical protein
MKRIFDNNFYLNLQKNLKGQMIQENQEPSIMTLGGIRTVSDFKDYDFILPHEHLFQNLSKFYTGNVISSFEFLDSRKMLLRILVWQIILLSEMTHIPI